MWAAPVLAAAAVRLALLALVVAHGGCAALSRADTQSYLLPGRNLLLHGSFAANGLPEILRTPGYPLFLALATLAGPIAAALIQILLSVLSVVLVGRLAFGVFATSRIAKTAAWIFAFEPLSATYSILLLPETLFLFLFLVALDRIAGFLRGQSLRVLAPAGVALAAAAFVRPVTYYLPVALAAGLLVSQARVAGTRWKAPALLLLSVVPLLAAWQLRNRVETGFAGFSAVGTRNLYFYTAADVTSREQHVPLAAAQNQLGYFSEQQFVAQHPAAACWNQAQRIDFMRTEALRVLRAHPATALHAYIAGSLRTAFNPGAAVPISLLAAPMDESAFTRERDQGPMQSAHWLISRHPRQFAAMAVFAVLLVALYALAVCGALWGGAPRACLGLLLGVALYFIAVSGGAAGIARLRLPIMPAVCVLAAAGLRRGKPAQ